MVVDLHANDGGAVAEIVGQSFRFLDERRPEALVPIWGVHVQRVDLWPWHQPAPNRLVAGRVENETQVAEGGAFEPGDEVDRFTSQLAPEASGVEERSAGRRRHLL